MRMVIHVGGGSGHLRPVIPIALASGRRGHYVVVAAEEALRPETEGFGLEFAGLPALPVDAEAGKRAMEHASEKDRPRMVLSMFFDHAAHCSEALSRVVDNTHADLILRGTIAWEAIFAGEEADVPVASFDFSPSSRPIVSGVIGDLFADYRRNHGLAPDPDLTALDRWLNLVGGPPAWFGDAQLSATTHLIQPPDPEGYPGETIGSLLSGFDDRPLVYATLGTTFNDEPGAWPMLLGGLGRGRGQRDRHSRTRSRPVYLWIATRQHTAG
jgi:UDP:flavonoid glycosyltransferase YjiC (YdhE family)